MFSINVFWFVFQVKHFNCKWKYCSFVVFSSANLPIFFEYV